MRMDEILQASSFLVVTRNGELVRIYCPFRALSLADGSGLEAGEKYRVNQVGFHEHLTLFYKIGGSYYHFLLLEPIESD